MPLEARVESYCGSSGVLKRPLVSWDLMIGISESLLGIGMIYVQRSSIGSRGEEEEKEAEEGKGKQPSSFIIILPKYRVQRYRDTG